MPELVSSNRSALTSIEAIAAAYLYIHASDETGSHPVNFVKKNLRRPIR